MTRHPSVTRSSPATRAFTLMEMLVVIGIIALLIGILLPTLSRVQQKAKRSQTENLLQEFVNACTVFQQQFGFYPGIVPESSLAADPKISSMENALLHLCGGAIPQDDPLYNTAPYNTWTEVTFAQNTPNQFKIRLQTYNAGTSVQTKLGDGPRIRGVQYKTFFAPKANDLLPAQGQYDVPSASVLDPYGIPDLIDSWGQPVLYLRQARPTASRLVAGATTGDNTNLNDCMFIAKGILPYVMSDALGEQLGSQADSIFRPMSTPTPSDPAQNLAQAIRNTSVGGPTAPQDGAPRGEIVAISAGKDGVYFSKYDGAGSLTTPKSNIYNDPRGPKVCEEYDDVRVFGGG